MSEMQKKTANTLAVVVTWLSIVGAAAGAILTQITDLGVQVPTVVLSILSVLALLARRIPAVPVDSPRGSSLAIGLLVAVLAMAGVAPPDTFTGPASVTDSIHAGDVLDVVEPGEAWDGQDAGDAGETWDGADPDVPLALYPAIGARLLIHGTLGVVGCSGAQQQVWKDAATKLGQCLAGLGVQGADNLVTAWMGGEAVDAAAIGWDLLPGFLDCATRFGAYVFTGLVPVTTRDSVGATMTPTARMLSALQEQGDPLALCGPRDGPPRCVVILPAP